MGFFMSPFPLSLFDVALLLVVVTGVLLVTAELLPPRYTSLNLLLERRRIRNAGLVAGASALGTLVVAVYTAYL